MNCRTHAFRDAAMIDLLYLLGTVAFFGLMLGYVAFCERIGQSDEAMALAPETRP
jgi:hypothetical protein